MLVRVAGKVADETMKDGKPFTARLEASTVVGGLATARTALNQKGIVDEQILELRARPVEGGSAIRFGKPADPNAPPRVRKAKTETAKTPAAGAAKK